MTNTVSQERSRNYVRQVRDSVLFKGGAALASFLTLPLMIHYLGQVKFGIWSTMLSIASWVVFFDLGVGTGLRNKVAESLAKGDLAEAGRYVSSGYSLIGIVAIGLFAAVGTAALFVPWQAVFNTRAVPASELLFVVLLTTLIVTVNFWIGLVSQVLNAVQKNAAVGFGQLLANALALLALYMLVSTSAGSSLLLMAAVYGVSLIVANVALSAWFYRQRPGLMPTWSLHAGHVRPLLSLGAHFFIIQCAALVILSTDKVLITQLFGPQYVTPYDVVFRLFVLLTMVHGIVSAPLWSAYTEAYHQRDMAWIRATLRQQLRLFGLICVAAVVLALAARPVIHIWIGRGLHFPTVLIISMAAYTMVTIWNNVFAYFVNGAGEIRLQVRTAIVGMIANIPLSLFLVKVVGMGVEGVVWATVISLLPFTLLVPFQVRALLTRGGYEAA